MVSIHATVRNFTPDSWNRLNGENPFATHSWLLMVEQCWRARAEPLYFALRRGESLVAISVCYAAEASPNVETLDDMLLGRLRPAASSAGFSFLPSMVNGPAQGYGWHIGIDPAIEESDRDGIRAELLDAMEAEADRRGIPLSFVQTLDDEQGLQAQLAARGYLVSRNVPIAVMDVGWPGIAEYFEHLPSRRRREYRRELRRNIDDGTTIEAIDSCHGVSDHLFALLEGNARRHGSVDFPFTHQVLLHLLSNMGGDVLIFVAREGEAISGVHLVLRSGSTAVAYAVGVDSRHGNDFTYFRLVYYHLIEYAIAHGIKRIGFGRGMYRAKVRRGCRLMGSRIYTRASGMARWKAAVWYPAASWWNRRKTWEARG